MVNLSVLKNGRARAIRFSTLAAICDALGCTPGDLLTSAPDAAARVDRLDITEVGLSDSRCYPHFHKMEWITPAGFDGGT